MLIDYVRNTAGRIIAEKEQNGVEPALCTLHELMNEVREDMTECMRELHRKGKYRASVNINKIPMLLIINKK